MNILIGGDLVPTESNIELFNAEKIRYLLGEELVSIWESASIRILNLEVPLTDKETPILKCGSNLRAPKSVIQGIRKINPTLLSLANNHILDHGEQGLKSTIDLLNENNIGFLGAGANLYEASRPHIIDIKDKKVGIYACAEYEFTIATEMKSGANPFDPLESLDHIEDLKQRCDYVIVLYHGGKEYYRYPSPYLQKVCRKIVDKGADLVVCQHSHCIGALEKYNGANIIYGQGNFIFDGNDDEYWNTSIIIELLFDDKININFIPICKELNKIRLANSDEKKKILDDFYERSNNIKKQDFIINKYNELAIRYKKSYLNACAGHNRLIRKVDSILGNKIIENKFNQRNLLSLINYIECEAHRELILQALKNEVNNR